MFGEVLRAHRMRLMLTQDEVADLRAAARRHGRPGRAAARRPFVIAGVYSGLEAENVAVGVVAARSHHVEIALGTVFGGGSFIVCVALGLGAVLFPLRVHVPRGVLLMFAATPSMSRSAWNLGGGPTPESYLVVGLG